MRILGIDPGLTTVGLGLIEMDSKHQITPIEWLTIETPKASPLPERLAELAKDLEDYLHESKPDLAVVEQIFFAKNRRTAMDTAHGRGVILLTLARAGVSVLSPAPLELKMAITGDGKADKKQMQSMVMRVLKLRETPSPPDAADALALALYGAYTSRSV